MMYDAAVIANYFINKSIYDGTELTPMKLLKMVYIAHGWHLGFGNGNLIHEVAEAWKYGPVIRSLYNRIRKYGTNQITTLIDLDGNHKIDANEYSVSDQVAEHLDSIWEYYKKYNGLQLSTLTHKEGSPWHKAHVEKRDIIPNKWIEEYYKKKADALPE